MPTTVIDLVLFSGLLASLSVAGLAGFYLVKGRLPEWPILNGIQRRIDAMDV
jgi:hypothetical protein